MIDWDRGTDILLNPRLDATDLAEVRRLIGCAPVLDRHVWLTTSGSTGRQKPVAIAKSALLVAADHVNRHLAATADDIWCRALPPFHVGGLGIHARACRSGSRVFVLERWDPVAFLDLLLDESVTLTSLVPTQLRDLLTEGLTSPPALRAVLVGGGAMPETLWRDAGRLGWPVLASYGATETCAAVAIARDPAAPPHGLPLLPHVEARTDNQGRLAFRGPSLLTGYATAQGLEDPKQDGWWVSGDLGTIADGVLTVHGRADDVVKVGGESVSLSALQATLDGLLPAAGVRDAAVRAEADPRLGHVIVLAIVGSRGDAEELRRRYDAQVLPFERAREAVLVTEIPRTELGKVRQ